MQKRSCPWACDGDHTLALQCWEQAAFTLETIVPIRYYLEHGVMLKVGKKCVKILRNYCRMLPCSGHS